MNWFYLAAVAVALFAVVEYLVFARFMVRRELDVNTGVVIFDCFSYSIVILFLVGLGNYVS